MARDTAGSMAWQVNASEILQDWLSQLDAESMARPRSHRIVGFAVYQMYQNARTPWFTKWARWHCPQIKFTRIASSSAPTKYMKIASSSASTKGFGGFWERNGESLEGRRTHARSVIILTINRETCGHWIQILKNARRCVVFVQSAPWHPKRLILNNVTCSVNETPSSCHIQPTSFYGQLGKVKNATSTAKRGGTQNIMTPTKNSGGWESDRSQAGVTLAQMRFTEKARGNGLILKQWAGEGRNAGDPGYPYEVLSRSLQIQQQELNVIPF